MKYTLLSLFLVGCIPTMPQGHEVDADAAIDSILRSYHYVLAGDRPKVFVVADQHCRATGPGFINPETGECVHGLFVYDRIYLVKPRSNLFSDTSLAHEMLHRLGYMHPSPGNWAPDSPEQLCIAHANTVLKTIPAADEIDR